MQLPNKSDWIILAIFYLIAIPVTFSGYDYSEGYWEPTMDTLNYVVMSFLSSYLIVYCLFPIFFPQKKVWTLFFWTILLMMVFGAIEIIGYRLIDGDDLKKFFAQDQVKRDFWWWTISNCAQNSGILVGLLIGKKFYDLQIDIQKKEKEQRESELRLLKAQMDPHFLFNNLNTVDSLIDSDPQTAKSYLNHLSQLYRYLITTKDDELVPLEEEIQFAKQYIYLLNIRFGNAYKFDLDINTDLSDKLIPPGALQTLLENVVKHNVATSEKPVVTEISVENESLIVSNNIQLKNSAKFSNKVGLKNLESRYQFLSDDKMIINQTDKFEVILPILKSI